MQELFKHRAFICLLLNKQKGSKSELIRKLIFLYDHKNSFTIFKLTSACIISILCISCSTDKENLFNSYKLFPSTSQLSFLLSSSLAKFFSAYFPSDFNISHLSQAHIFSHISWISSLLGEFTTSIPSTSSINFASCKHKSWI